MSVNEKLVDELSSAIHAKYHDVASQEHIRNAISIHIDRFFKSVVKSAVVMGSAFNLSMNEDDANDSSEEMWNSLSQSKFVSCYEFSI
jgi:hypothetical protein